MAHCGSCKSNLGTGGKRGTGGLYGVQGALARATRATGTGAGHQRPIEITSFNLGPALVRSNGKINKAAWVPATSTLDASELTQWAYFPGGSKAILHIGGVTQTRYVLAHKNGGPTGVLVRLGEIAREMGTGGCGDLTGLPGTGGAPSVNMRSGASWKGTGLSKGTYKWTAHPTTGKQVANRWFKATYGPQPESEPDSWVKLIGPVPGPAELWMSGQGPLHKHDVEVIQVTASIANGEFNALVAGWSLPHMINDIKANLPSKDNRRAPLRSITSSYPGTGGKTGTGGCGPNTRRRAAATQYYPGTGGQKVGTYYPAGTGGARAEAQGLLVKQPKYLTMSGDK